MSSFSRVYVITFVIIVQMKRFLTDIFYQASDFCFWIILEDCKRSAGVAPEVSSKLRAEVNRSSKQACQWPHEMDLYPPTIKKERLQFYKHLLIWWFC